MALPRVGRGGHALPCSDALRAEGSALPGSGGTGPDPRSYPEIMASRGLSPRSVLVVINRLESLSELHEELVPELALKSELRSYRVVRVASVVAAAVIDMAIGAWRGCCWSRSQLRPPRCAWVGWRWSALRVAMLAWRNTSRYAWPLRFVFVNLRISTGDCGGDLGLKRNQEETARSTRSKEELL